MTNATKIILAVIAGLTTALQVPMVHDLLVGVIQAHPDLSSLIGGLLTVLALLHNPAKKEVVSSQSSVVSKNGTGN